MHKHFQCTEVLLLEMKAKHFLNNNKGLILKCNYSEVEGYERGTLSEVKILLQLISGMRPMKLPQLKTRFH